MRPGKAFSFGFVSAGWKGDTEITVGRHHQGNISTINSSDEQMLEGSSISKRVARGRCQYTCL